MRIGASLALIAIGAILRFAVSDHLNGVDLPVIGVILMIVGAIGLVLTLILVAVDRRQTGAVLHDRGYDRTPADRY